VITPVPSMTDLLDRERIRDTLARLSRGEDRRDAAALRGCYWPDATVDFGVFVGGFDDYLAWVVPGSPAIPVTLHTLGQSLIALDGGGAAVETHVTAYHRIDMGTEEHDVVLGGRYLDRMARRDGEWRVAHRTMLYDWQQDFGRSVDWTHGLMGMPFLTNHSIGAAIADHSVAFLSQEQL
jgi:hypothetical protein